MFKSTEFKFVIFVILMFPFCLWFLIDDKKLSDGWLECGILFVAIFLFILLWIFGQDCLRKLQSFVLVRIKKQPDQPKNVFNQPAPEAHTESDFI